MNDIDRRQDELNLKTVWSTKKVDKLIKDLENGADISYNPFYQGDQDFREANLIYEYTQEEILEIKRCQQDIIYFAEKYCKVMTDDGIMSVKLRPYQKMVLKSFQDNRFVVVMMARQSGKTITTAIFIAWYALFNYDKNILVIANKGATTAEIIDKIKVIFKGLPFFMKPGLVVNNVMTMKFDNGCRLFGQATTKTAAIGFTIHLCYMDEFAHIQPTYLEPFYRSVYPTISSSKIAKIVISSTPNGMNKFYDIYQGAIEGSNEYTPIRVDWWDVPGRDDEWVKQTIANLGSIELFNQEYGNQFLTNSKLLLTGQTLKFIKNNLKTYEWRDIEALEHLNINKNFLGWNPSFNFDSIENGKFVFSIDIANGGGGDYSIINIFKLVPLPINVIESMTDYEDETSFFGLYQVGLFRSNSMDVSDFIDVTKAIVYDVFEPENLCIIVETNFKGELLIDKLESHKNYYEGMLLHTKHAEASKIFKPGIRLNSANKQEYCFELKTNAKNKRVIITESKSFNELSSFGQTKKGSYASQSGNDDIAMTLVNLSPFFSSDNYIGMVEESFDNIPQKYKVAIDNKILNRKDDSQDFSLDYLREIQN